MPYSFAKGRNSGATSSLKELLNPMLPMSIWHTTSFKVLGIITAPISLISAFAANMTIIFGLMIVWLLPIMLPIVVLLVYFCDPSVAAAKRTARAARAVEGNRITAAAKRAANKAKVAGRKAD